MYMYVRMYLKRQTLALSEYLAAIPASLTQPRRTLHYTSLH